MAKTKIGKNVIENLTRSMYEDPRCIFREYIQNAADQIDLATEQNLEPDNYYDIHVRIFRGDKRIVIEDTATGVPYEQLDTLRDVAASMKRRGHQKGFRGIGRLGGLAYCSTLIFETSAKGENVKNKMHWDAEKMNRLLDDESYDKDAATVIDEIITESQEKEAEDKHYFRVIMENVSDDRLLDIEDIRDYLRMVAPVDYPTAFTRFAAEIKQYAAEHGAKIDTYHLYLGDENDEEQIFKAYTPVIIDKKNGDYEVKAIQKFHRYDQNGYLMYWGWYSISETRGQIPSYNVPYGMRLREKNIQVGNERTCRNFFTSEGDKRFAQYFYGEVHVETSELVPDARRDYLRVCSLRCEFERLIREDFKALKDLCKDASDWRSLIKKLENAEKGQKDIVEKQKQPNPYLTPSEKEKDEEKFKQLQKDLEETNQKIERAKQKAEENKSPLKNIYFGGGNSGNTTTPTTTSPVPPQEKSHLPANNANNEKRLVTGGLRTDGSFYAHFNQGEKDVLNSVYQAIYKTIPDEDFRELLIRKIEKELTR